MLLGVSWDRLVINWVVPLCSIKLLIRIRVGGLLGRVWYFSPHKKAHLLNCQNLTSKVTF